MDLQISVTPHSSELLLWGGIVLIISSLLYLKLLSVVERTRRTFHALQPDLSITRSATVYSYGEDTLKIFLRNGGGSQAIDIRVTVHGGEGIDPLPVIPVIIPGDAEHEVWIKATSGSPLLQEKRNTIRLQIRYRDQWGYVYSLSHPVVQRESIHGWVALQLVERVKSRKSKPSVSFLRMRVALLLNSSTGMAGTKENVAQVYKSDNRDGLAGHSQHNSYLTRVWLSQNTEGRKEEVRKFSHLATRTSTP